jgi:uncharacterized OB-fold protein
MGWGVAISAVITAAASMASKPENPKIEFFKCDHCGSTSVDVEENCRNCGSPLKHKINSDDL